MPHTQKTLRVSGRFRWASRTNGADVEFVHLNVRNGDCVPPIGNIAQLALEKLFLKLTIPFSWQDVEASGAIHSESTSILAGVNVRSFPRHQGNYRTIGELANASGVPCQTICEWEGTCLPVFGQSDGIRVIPAAEFDLLVARCRALHIPKIRCRRHP